jgi:ribosomal protein S27AE
MVYTLPPKLCPRCTGFMLAEDDTHGEFSTCVQCGYVHENEVADPEDIKKEEELAFGKLRRRQPSHGKLRL